MYTAISLILLFREWTKQMQNKGVKVLPRFVFDGWSADDFTFFLGAISRVELFSKQVLELCQKNKFDGVVVDCGHGACTTAAVIGAQTVAGSACQVPIGGVDITSQLRSAVVTELAGEDSTGLSAMGASYAVRCV